MRDTFDFWSETGLEPDHDRIMTRGAKKHSHALASRLIGRNIAFGKGGGGDAPPPDPNIGNAAVMNAQLGSQWLDFAKKQFAEGNVRQAETDALNKKVIDQQLATQDQANQWAQEDRNRTKTVFQPLQDEFIQTAKTYDSPERESQMAAEAAADVQKQADTQRAINTRNMASMGVNPASGRFAGISRATDLNTAVASAGAANSARQGVRDKALALKADAINLGNGLPSSTAAAYGIGVNSGNSAVGNRASGNANFYQNGQVMNSGFGGAMQGYANQGNILNNLYGNQLSAWNAQNQANATSSAGIGSMVGTIAGAGLTAF